MTTGISLCTNSHREIPVMNTGSLQWEQGFPVIKQGFPCENLLHRENPVLALYWPCTGLQCCMRPFLPCIWTLWLSGVLESRMKSIFKSWFLGITWLWLLWVKFICLLYIFSSLHFLFQETDGTQIGSAKTAKDALLLWCQMKTAGYHNVNIRNFTTR